MPDLYVGRWAISNHDELHNILEKSIHYDLTVPEDRRIALFTGTGDTQNLRFSEASIYVRNLIQNEVTNNSCIHYDGADGFNASYMFLEFENNSDLMLAYRGHGGRYCFGSPFSTISINNLPHHLPYFTYSIACYTGYSDGGLGIRWLNEGERSVSFYGATVSTYRSYNNALEKSIFNGLKDYVNYTIGEFTYKGVGEYFSDGGSRLEVCSYVLYGDPSLYIYGTELFGNPVQYIRGRNSEIEDIKLGTNVKYTIYTLYGLEIKTGFGQHNLTISTQDLTNGIYIIKLEDTTNNSLNSI